MDALAEKRYREDREREEELDALYEERISRPMLRV
jgi:hypothetical protein